MSNYKDGSWSKTNRLFFEHLTEPEKEWYWLLHNQHVIIQQELHKLVVRGHSRRHYLKKKEAQCGNH